MPRFATLLIPFALCAAATSAGQEMPAGRVPMDAPPPAPEPPPPAYMQEGNETACPPSDAAAIAVLRTLTAQQKLYIAALEKRINTLQGGH